MKKIYAYSFLPQNYLTEEILLGSILIIPRIFPHINQLIQPNYFFLISHQTIYIHLKSLYQENKLNSTELILDLHQHKTLNKIGGIHKIIDIMLQSQIFISSTYLNLYITEIIHTIKQNYIKRVLIQYGYNIIELAYKPKICSYSLYNKASNYLNITHDKLPKDDIENLQKIIGDILLNLNHTSSSMSEDNNYYNSIKSGFKEIDQLTYGLQNGDLIILAGRPATGKTSLIINITINILQTTNCGVYIFSLEMSRQQIIYKCLSILNQININHILTNNLNHNELTFIKKSCQDLLNSSLYINDTPNISIDYIEYTTKSLMHNSRNNNLLIIDYLQLIQANHKTYNNRTQELSYITRKLKVLAQYLNIPIIVLSQLNRNIETRVDKRPLLSDLRESGCILYNESIAINQYYYFNISKNLVPKTSSSLINLYNQLLYSFFAIPWTIKLNIEYLFTFNINRHIYISLTHNHKLVNQKKWDKYSIYREYDILSSLNQKKYQSTQYIAFIKRILFTNYNKTYDMQTYNYQYLISNYIIIHNSIEQDADIVMMLNYNNDQTILNNQKNIDIIICKNRNGPIGICHLIFKNNTTTFINLYE